MSEIQKISVIGAGTMGSGIAHTFALGGYKVNLVDTDDELVTKSLSTIETNLQRQVSKNAVTSDEAETAVKNISINSNMESTSDSDLVVEAVFEKLDVKLNVFETLDKICDPETILASNTSSISITEIASATNRPESVIGMHFFNPVPLMKLVEIVRGKSTSDTVFGIIRKVVEKLGKSPVEVNDSPGFISNRLLMPMINEAVFALMEGVSSAEDIDSVMTLGMNHPMGPLKLADFIGLDVCLNIMEVLRDGLEENKYRPCPLLEKKVAAGELGKKSGIGFYEYSNV